jgi:hypothetical protein
VVRGVESQPMGKFFWHTPGIFIIPDRKDNEMLESEMKFDSKGAKLNQSV